VKSLISLVPGMGPIIAAHEIGETALRQFWEQTDGSLTKRLHQVKELVVNEADHGGDSQAEELGK
jgi:aspartate/tyrosine/aromatic aminotransferase